VSSGEVRDCVTRQWVRFALGRVEGEEDACSLAAIGHTFAGADFSVRELMVGIVTSDAFRYRPANVAAAALEGTP
jgi:hypothetical protein